MATGTEHILKLNTGASFPAVGLGTWKAEPGQVGAAVKEAIKAGYRHIDGALCYQNEKEIGHALKEVFDEGIVKREDLFYTSKLWNSYHKPQDVAKGLEQTLSDLNIGYLDLYLVHWPVAFTPQNNNPSNLFPKTPEGRIDFSTTDILATWHAMEKLVETGKVKAIGVSNFDIHTLERLLAGAKIRPAVHQVELHPYLPQPKLVEFCKSQGIAVTAYSPLGSGHEPSLIKDETIVEIAKKHDANAGQILVSWAVKRGTAVLPKSVNAERIRQNLKYVDLDDDDMSKIASIKTRKRTCDPEEFWSYNLFKGALNE